MGQTNQYLHIQLKVEWDPHPIHPNLAGRAEFATEICAKSRIPPSRWSTLAFRRWHSLSPPAPALRGRQLSGDANMKLLTYRQLSLILGIPIGTLHRMVHEHSIPHVRLGLRTVRFRPEEVEAWVLARSVGPVAPPQAEGGR